MKSRVQLTSKSTSENEGAFLKVEDAVANVTMQLISSRKRKN